MKLKVLPKPCDSCPYARKTPPGVWHPDEYRKLKLFDDPLADPTAPVLATFLCHNGGTPGANDTVCRGWLSVHRDSVPVRLALSQGRLGAEDVPDDLEPGLYATGAEACAAGLKGVPRPTKATKAAVAKIEHKLLKKADHPHETRALAFSIRNGYRCVVCRCEHVVGGPAFEGNYRVCGDCAELIEAAYTNAAQELHKRGEAPMGVIRMKPIMVILGMTWENLTKKEIVPSRSPSKRGSGPKT